jgi:DUF4097 and DUF4098 domain-containing protein YvlB
MREFDLPGPITLQAKVGAGALTVVAEPRETATVEVEPYQNTEASRDAADRTVVALRDDTLVVEAPDNGWSWRRWGHIRVRVHVPEDTRLKVKVASADATLTGRYGDSVVDAASGDVDLGHVTGWLRLHTASGDARVERVDGQAGVDSASGDIRLGYVGGETTVQSASGDVSVGRAEASVRVKTASGDLRVESIRRGEARLTTASGDVEVGVPAGTSVWLDVSTVGGRTRSDLQQIHGAPAGGTPDVSLHVSTASGDIDLRRVEVPDAA